MKFSTITHIILKNIQYWFYKRTRQGHKIIPYKILIELTNLCNSKCQHCDIWKISPPESMQINLNHLDSFLKKMDRNLLWLALSGGEVTLFNDFYKLIDIINERSKNIRLMTFTTNGLVPHKVLEYSLYIKKKMTCDLFITISLDGDKKTHDAIRGVSGNYEKAMETYSLLRKNNISCHFGLTVTSENHSFIKKSFRTYRDQIKAITFLHSQGIFLKENGTSNDKKIIDSLQHIDKHYKISSLGEIIMKISIKVGILFLRKKRQVNIIPCDVGRSSAHLLANGNITPCMYFPSLGNIKDNHGLENLFHSQKARNIQKKIRQDQCEHCWMNCYAPHSIFQHPLKSLKVLFKKVL